MQIFFSGASSFTGHWFCKELAQRGHRVVAIFSKNLDEYSGVRKKRIQASLPFITPIWNAPLGSENFFKAIECEDHWDHFCHHASLVEGYQKEGFSPEKALENNTQGLCSALQSFKKLTYTTTIFEESTCKYGLSKKLTSEWLQKSCLNLKIPYQRFVITNPFGPLEEKRFTSYLLNEWKAKRTPEIRTPDYIRDNIPVTALAKAYADFILTDSEEVTPSFYSGTQESFTSRLSHEAKKRWGTPCSYTAKKQTDFSQPMSLVGSNPIKNFNEEEFWNHYLQ